MGEICVAPGASVGVDVVDVTVEADGNVAVSLGTTVGSAVGAIVTVSDGIGMDVMVDTKGTI